MNYQKLKEIIDNAERYQKTKMLNRVENYIAWYEGRFKNRTQKEIPYKVNLTYQLAKTIRVSIYSENPSFQVKIGQSVEDSSLRRQSQRLLEEGLKTMLNRMGTHRVNRRIIDDTVICGFGCSKIGYNSVYKDSELNTATSATNKLSEPFINRISPVNIILPPEATNPINVAWICEVIYVNKAVAEKFFGKKNMPSENKDGSNDAIDYVKIYEFHDFNDKKIYTVVEGYNKIFTTVDYPLIDEDGNCKSLYQLLWFNDNISDCVYPLSDIDYVSDQIIEANEAVSRRINFANKSRAGLFISGEWDEKDLKNLREGGDGYIVKSLDGKATVNNVPLMSLGQEFYQNIEYIRQEIFETLGITDYMVGTGGGRMATEAQLIDKSRADRVGDRVRIIEDFFFLQIDTLIELIKQYEEVGIEINDMYGDEMIAGSINSELLQTTDAQVVVITGSTVELDGTKELMKMEKIIQMAAALDPMVAQSVFKRLLEREGFGDLVQDVVPNGMPVNMPGMQGTEGVPSSTPMEQGRMPNLGIVENI